MAVSRADTLHMAGPAPGIQWHEKLGTDEYGEEVAVLTAPDAANSDRLNTGMSRLYHAILARPAVARAGDGASRLSLTFVLERIPSPEAAELAPLIREAVLGMDMTVAPSVSLLKSISGQDEEYRALFPVNAVFFLEDTAASQRLAETSVSMGQLTVPLQATLDRDLALQLLDAVNGRAGSLRLGARLSYRVAGPSPGYRLSADVARVHEFLSSVAGPERIFYEKDVQNYLTLMIEQPDLVEVEGEGNDEVVNNSALAATVLPSFLRAMRLILTRSDEHEAIAGLGEAYSLIDRSPPSMTVRFSVSEIQATTTSLDVQASLHEFVAAALKGQDLDRIIHLVAIDEDGRGVRELPRRVHNRPASKSKPGDAIELAVMDHSVLAIAHAIKPVSSTQPAAAHALLAAYHHRPHHIDALALEDIVIHLGQEQRRHLPVLDDPKSPLWPDRIDATDRYWYAPAFSVVEPDPQANPDESPFLFSFWTAGHDMHGRPGLEANLRVTLSRATPDAVQQKLNELGAQKAEPVETKNLSFVLEIPFRDQHGQTQVETCQCSLIERQGDRAMVTFRLRNDWVRLCYGALAYADFQVEPARVSAAYVFEAYVPITDGNFQILYGGKSVQLPVAYTAHDRERLSDRVHVDAGDASIKFRVGELRFGAIEHTAARAAAPVTVVAAATVSTHPVSLPAIRPELHAATPFWNKFIRKKYAIRSELRRTRSDLFLPCNVYGGLYREELDAGPRVVACQDTLRLGETDYRLFEELSLPRPGYRVYRSLQTPGRFLVVPDIYAISRLAPDSGGNAYRPTVLLYSTINVEDLTQSRCVILASLEPDIPAFERARLRTELRQAYYPDPEILYLTELEGELTFDWVLPTGGLLRLEIEATRLWDGFEVSLVTDAVGVPQLGAILSASGVSGTATLRLPDGMSLRTALRLHLSRIVGPWDRGPIDVTLSAGGDVSLRNAIESTVNVGDLLILDAAGTVASTVRVGARLEPEAETTVSVPAGTTSTLPVYSIEASPSDLKEIRSYIEDIKVNLVLVNRIDFSGQDLKEVRLTGRIRGLEGEDEAAFTADSASAASLDFSLPLTVYLADPIIEYRATVEDRDDQKRVLAWKSWHLGTQGVIMEVTSEAIGLA
ncbi:MAG: hypothetical protein GY906_10890 [bacterium]|nr:hypothetical protein [bacterium]